jgi:hypothetical protein
VIVADQANHTLNIVSMAPIAGVASPSGSHAGTMTGRAIVVRDTATLTAIAEWAAAQFRATPVGTSPEH